MSVAVTSPTSAVASQPPKGMKPGEFVHYYANLLTLFRDTRPLAEINSMARAAVSLRERRMEEFNRRLEDASAFFKRSGGKERLRPHLAGWDGERIQRLRRLHGGLLLAIYHYGEHRQIISDLCCLGIPFVAPIAKRSYFDAPAVFSRAPEDCVAAPQLLEVESRSVGRNLLSGLKRGRIGLIYVDGNMGPDGHLVEESGVEIEFIGHRIRVKCGVARLAMAMRLPVLPMLAIPVSDTPDSPHRLLAIPEIIPPDAKQAEEDASRQIMQACYNVLAEAVSKAPQHWEFAFCLHRWLRTNTSDSALSPAPPLSLTSLRRGGGADGVARSVDDHSIPA